MIFKDKYGLSIIEVKDTHRGTVRIRVKNAAGHELLGVFEPDDAREIARHILALVGEGDDK